MPYQKYLVTGKSVNRTVEEGKEPTFEYYLSLDRSPSGDEVLNQTLFLNGFKNIEVSRDDYEAAVLGHFVWVESIPAINRLAFREPK